MIIDQNIVLYANNKKVSPVVNMVQGDTGRRLVCKIEGLALTSSMSAMMWFERPDGSVYSKSGTVSTASQQITVELSAAGGALTQVGEVKAQLKIMNSGAVVSTFEFLIVVHRNESGTATTEDITWRDQVIADINEFIGSFEELL